MDRSQRRMKTAHSATKPNLCFRFILLLALFSLLLSACQPLGLRVEQVAALADLSSVRAPDCSYGGAIRSVEALDSYTVKFSLCAPDPAFPAKMAFPVFAINDDAYLAEHGGDSRSMSAQPNGSGAYRVKEYTPGLSLTLEVNPDYWGVPPRLREIRFRWEASPIYRLVEVINAYAQAIDRPDADMYYSIEQNADLRMVYRPSLNLALIGMNNRYPPFDDVRVRQGLSMLIDRGQIVSAAYPFSSSVAEQFLSPLFQVGHTPLLTWLPYDPQRGLDLLRQAGFDFNQELTLTYSNAGSDLFHDPHRVAQIIRSQLLPYGVKVTLKRVDPKPFETSVQAGQVAFFLYGWNADYPDPTSLFNTLFAPGSQLFGDAYPDVLDTAAQAGKTGDPGERQRLYNQVNDLMLEHAPAIPLAHVSTAVVFRNEVQGVAVNQSVENMEEMTAPDQRLIFMQTQPPESLWPGDAVNGDTFRITRLLYSTLVDYEYGSIGLRPSLAESWSANPDQTEWTFNLRYGVRFTNGAVLDANDVVASFAALWDAGNPNHRGDSGEFIIFRRFFGQLLNQ
ncbi:MAG: ABC transporter substrate-binding protein [Chloroflexota bacterium]